MKVPVAPAYIAMECAIRTDYKFRVKSSPKYEWFLQGLLSKDSEKRLKALDKIAYRNLAEGIFTLVERLFFML